MLRPAAFKMLVGPTTPLSPILFDHGIHVLAGAVVTDLEPVLAAVSQGASFRQIPGVKRVLLRRR